MSNHERSYPDESSGARLVQFSSFASIARRQADAMATDPKAAREHAAIAIVFGHAAAELYINDAGARLPGDNYFKEYLDRVDIMAKWSIVSRMAGHRIDPGGAAMDSLDKLRKARNDLMHPKVVGINMETAKVDKILKRLADQDSMLPIAREVPKTLDRLRAAAKLFDPPPTSLADEFL
jgi:hypothetical protein